MGKWQIEIILLGHSTQGGDAGKRMINFSFFHVYFIVIDSVQSYLINLLFSS